MITPEETHVSLIPRNFIERGTFMGGMFKIRNAIEGGILAATVTVPIVHLPLTVTARIIIFCVTALPAAMVAFIGIGGESLTAFFMNAVRFVKNRRIIYRRDIKQQALKQRRLNHSREPKARRHRKNKS